ncbi:glycerate kinase [Saccharothrix ecbatanensis]|uniref:Glycerate kinase n=1 Tax=Saccharothrix ecbatanensis TaxID=1105145 RepID=A0A7W9HK97_9PSEU|nr:glycerate kinase [Saccharothrix ecbatanensis]MBB5803526.1 glycerate kinase [Saccharothrix ecbatanensis]
MNGTVLVCLDKFRGSLTAERACSAVSEGITDAGGRAVAMPVADGGEGTVAALVRAGYDEVRVEVSGPTGEPVRAALAVRGERAVIEMAQASGLDVLPGGRLAPLTADTFGTGELIRAALDRGCRDLVLAVGGSATTDGGAGLLRALGARITGASGEPVGPGGEALVGAACVDLSGLDPRLALARVTLASDVDNPLIGPNGAAVVFAPQKGATAGDVEVLERGLCRFAAVMAAEVGRDVSGKPGAGAAGGIGFAALAALDARRASGADFVLREIGVEDALREASLVVVGEGRFDEQSLRGKAPIGVAEAARRHGVPVVVVAGDVRLSAERLRDVGVVAAWSLLERTGDVDTAMRQAPALLTAIGRELVTQAPIVGAEGR